MNKKLDRKIYRKYKANHWWLRDYTKHNITINQYFINKIFKKFGIKGKIIQYPSIVEESENIFLANIGLIKTNLLSIKNKRKFNRYVKFLEMYNYNIQDENLIN